MPGFFITNSANPIKYLKNYTSQTCIENEIISNGFLVKRNTLAKFLEDKPFFEDERYIVVFEGVILNKNLLMEKYNEPDFNNLVINMAGKDKLFFSEFKGSFSGAIYYKKDRQWIVFTNQTGEKQVFYYQNGHSIVIASQVNYILGQIKENHDAITLDKQAVYSMYAYMYTVVIHLRMKYIGSQQGNI